VLFRPYADFRSHQKRRFPVDLRVRAARCEKAPVLGEALSGVTAYNIYRNTLGQFILDPVKAVPAAEMWLYQNPQALASVKRGLRESAEGKSVYHGSFAKHAKE
jgi:hypothetical protein